MKSKFFKFLLFFLLWIVLILGCDFFDVGGIFYSSPVTERFRQKDNLKNFPPPVIADPENFNFILMADPHYYKTQPNYIKYIENNKTVWNLSFIILLGDITQNGEPGAFQLVKTDIAATTLPVYPVIGNHDLYFNGFENYKNFFGRTIYEIKIGTVLQLIFLDTANGTIGEEQKNWFESVLQNSPCRYTIVCTHYSPTDKEWQSPTAMSYPEDAYYLFNICDYYNVDYFICGHLHYYDYKEIRGVKYIIVTNTADYKDTLLIISIRNGVLSHRVF